MFVYSPQLNGKEGSLLTTRSVFNLLIDNSVFRNRYINMSIVVGNLPNMHTVYIMMDLFQRYWRLAVEKRRAEFQKVA